MQVPFCANSTLRTAPIRWPLRAQARLRPEPSLGWGNTQKATWAWRDECVDEACAILPLEAKEPDFAPGFDFAQLQADLADAAS